MPSLNQTGAIAVFVKTPGLSPVKTRLAATIGRSSAERFHAISAKAVESVVRRAVSDSSLLAPYWAVAESGALELPQWRSFQTIWQGDGGLGERLARVYDELIQRHRFVLFIGADSPHLSSHLLTESARILSQGAGQTFVIGRAEDGGFHLFGGSAPIERRVWLSVPYSSPETAAKLVEGLNGYGHEIKEMPSLLDVDTEADLERLMLAATTSAGLTSEQSELLRWVQDFLEKKRMKASAEQET